MSFAARFVDGIRALPAADQGRHSATTKQMARGTSSTFSMSRFPAWFVGKCGVSKVWSGRLAIISGCQASVTALGLAPCRPTASQVQQQQGGAQQEILSQRQGGGASVTESTCGASCEMIQRVVTAHRGNGPGYSTTELRPTRLGKISPGNPPRRGRRRCCDWDLGLDAVRSCFGHARGSPLKKKKKLPLVPPGVGG